MKKTLAEFEADYRERHRQMKKIAEEKEREKKWLETDLHFSLLHERSKRYWKKRRRDGKW